MEIELWSETNVSNSNLAHAFLHIDIEKRLEVTTQAMTSLLESHVL